MSATFCRVVNGGALVTACRAVTAVSLSANNVGFGAGVTLSWSGAAGGAGNPIRGYEVYRDGVLLTTVFDGTSCTVTSPTSNGSYKYTVKALGSIAGFDAPVSTASATLTSKVSAPTAPTSVKLSATDVRVGKSVTLSWSGAAGGTNNPVAKYHVYRGGAYLTETTGTSCAVTASGTAGGKYTYTVYAIGSVSGWNSGASAGVTLTAHGAEHVDYYFTSSGTYTVPSWAERVDVSCIGGGASGTSGGYSQFGTNGCPGGGGGSGYITNMNSVAFTPNAKIAITVGAGGAATAEPGTTGVYTVGKRGGTSSYGSAVSAVGGYGGPTQGAANNENSACAGGNGGFGGGGGSQSANQQCGCGGNGQGTYGGGRSASNTTAIIYYASVGGGGSYKGTNGSLRGAKENTDNAGITSSIAQLYAFSDTQTQRYLGPGGNGGNNSGYGGRGGHASGVSGTAYGAGGKGGDLWAGGAAGNGGLVAVRAWRYVS